MSYTRLETDDQVVSSEQVVSTLWTTGNLSLTTFYTSSVQDASNTGKFYLNAYDIDPTSSAAEVQFSVAYGDVYGSGSAYFNSVVTDRTPTKDIYGQYKALILGDETSLFTFDTTHTIRDIVVLSVARSRYKQAFNPGSLTLKLSDGSGNDLYLTDNSAAQTSATFINATQYYTLVSGSQGVVNNSTATPSGSYGYVFPDLGMIMLNPQALALPVVDGGLAVSWDYTNSAGSFTQQSPNNHIAAELFSNNFSLQASEVLSSNYFFCRVKNGYYNYTANPTIIDDNGYLVYNELINSPVTYITTVGLYNDNNELLAVAKLSKPLQKDFTKEALLRVKLDY